MTDKIKVITIENKEFRNSLNDYKMTLGLKKDILYQSFPSTNNKNDELSLLRIKVKEKIESIIQKYKNKTNIDKNVYILYKFQSSKLSQTIDANGEFSKLCEEYKKQIIQLQRKINEKEQVIINYYNQLNHIKTTRISNPKREIVVAKASENFIELNNELIYSTETISGVNEVLKEELIKNNKLENQKRVKIVYDL